MSELCYQRARDGATVIARDTVVRNPIAGERYVSARRVGARTWTVWAESVFLQYHTLSENQELPQPEPEAEGDWETRLMKGWAAPGTVFPPEVV